MPNSLSVTNALDGQGNVTNSNSNVPGINFGYQYNKFGQIIQEHNPSGLTINYEYNNETVPGASSTTLSSRDLDTSTGGYLKKVYSDFETHNFKTYDDKGDLKSYTNNMGITGNYTTNDFSELTNETLTSPATLSPLNLDTHYSYDNNGNLLTKKINSSLFSKSYSYTYDIRNNMKTDTEINRGTTSYDYDNNDNLVRIIDPVGKGMEIGYNNRDLVSYVKTGLETNADTFNFSYDGNSNILNSTDAYGNSTLYTYDGYDRMKTATDPIGNITEIARSNQGNTISILRKNSAQDILRQTITVNDPVGRMLSRTVKVSEGNDVVYTYIYSEDGRTVTVTDPNGGVYTVIKNEFDQIIKESDPLGNSIEYFYLDGRGNMTKKIETEKGDDSSTKEYITLYEYNAQNKLEKITDALNNVTTFTYDGLGNLITSKDAEGNTINHQYDSFGRKIKTTRVTSEGLNVETNFEYYPDNKLKSITDAKGNKTSYEYDFQGKISKVIYPDNTFIENTYTTALDGDKTVKKVITKQRDGTLVTDIYNVNGLIKNRQITHGASTAGTTYENFIYDGLNRVTQMTDDDSTVGFTYDTLNRVTQETQQAKLVKYTYDKLNNLTAIQYPDNRIIERTFDAVRRIKGIKEGANNIASYNYAGKGFRYMSKQFGNGDAISYLYDQGRRLTSKETNNKNSILINKYVYAYNKINMKTFEQRGHENNKADIYNYDALYRLKDITFNADDSVSPTTFDKKKRVNFDKVDNILKLITNQGGETSEITTQVNNLNQYIQFDQWGLAHDLNGNTSQKGTQFFTYDYRIQLISVRGEGTEVTFKYDVLGRRIEKEVGANLIKYFYAGNQVIEERNGSDTVMKQYIYGNGIDEVLRVDRNESGTMIPYYYHTNDIGSITAITDNSGDLVEKYSYDLYGMPTIKDASDQEISQSSIGNKYMFHGRRYDPETNLYYYRARYYDPIMGRFLQTDPMGYQDSMNLYQAFNMNGINYIDPFGEIVNPKVDPAVAKSAYVQFMRYYGNHAAAMKRMYTYKYTIRTGVDDTLSKADELYEMSLGMSPILDGGKKLLTVMAIADTAVIGVASATSVSWIKLAVGVYNTIAMYGTESLVTSTVGYNLYKSKEGIKRVIELIKRSPEVVAKIKELVFKVGYYKEQIKFAFDEKVGGVTKKLFERFLPQAKEISEEGVGKFIRDFIKGSAKANIPGPPRLNTLGEYVGYIFTLIVKKTAGK